MNRIKAYLGSSRTVLIGIAVIFASAGIAQAAATTIGTYITTSGALTVSGISTLGGNGTASTTVDASGNTSIVGTLGVTGLSTLTGGAKVGASGSTLNQIVKGTCSLYSGSGITTIAATSTLNLDCQANGGVGVASPITGIASGDTVFIQTPTSFPAGVFTGLRVLGATASSTTGYIQVALYNGTGATYTLTSAATSSLQYLDIH